MASEDSLVKRVQALYAKAESTQFEEERNTFLAKADQLVRDYALAAALEDANRSKEEQETVAAVTVEVTDSGIWGTHMRSIIAMAARHCNVYPVTFGFSRMQLIGFKSDIDFTQMLFATLQIHFLRNLEPSWDPAQGLDANVYVFKEAGIKWRAIQRVAVLNGHDIPWTPQGQDGRRLINAYRRHCKVLDVEPTNQTQSHEEYRDGFANMYVGRLEERLRDMRDAYDPDAVAQGAALALRSRMDRVMDKVYEMYPQLHPEEVKRKRREAEENAQKWWDSLSDKEKEAYRKSLRGGATPRESEARYRARHAGYRAGRSAADSANLNPGASDLGAQTRKAIR